MARITASAVSMRLTFQGAWECSALVNGYYEHVQYMGYTKREALRMFLQQINA